MTAIIHRAWPTGLAVLGMVLCAFPLDACQICLPIPKDSLADHLIAADLVVLARENPDQPFSLRTVEVLKGEPGEARIDLFLDSSTRRVLGMFPDREVVCVRNSNAPEAGWRRVAVTNDVVEPIVRETILRAPDWAGAPERRLRFFAEFLGHDDAQLRTLAHLEVARAPYDEIKGLGAILSRTELRAFLANIRYIEWHGLYILLLGSGSHEEDHALILQEVRNCEHYGLTTNLAAWATAYIERDGEAALRFFDAKYFRNQSRKPEELKALCLALSVHGSKGHVHLRDRIVESYGELLGHHPGLATQIVGDLTAWKRWDLAEPVAAVLASPPPELDQAAILQLRSYLRQAAQAASPPSAPASAPRDFTLLWILALLVFVPVILVIVGKRR